MDSCCKQRLRALMRQCLRMRHFRCGQAWQSIARLAAPAYTAFPAGLRAAGTSECVSSRSCGPWPLCWLRMPICRTWPRRSARSLALSGRRASGVRLPTREAFGKGCRRTGPAALGRVGFQHAVYESQRVPAAGPDGGECSWGTTRLERKEKRACYCKLKR